MMSKPIKLNGSDLAWIAGRHKARVTTTMKELRILLLSDSGLKDHPALKEALRVLKEYRVKLDQV